MASVRQAIIAKGYLAPRIEEPDIRLDSAANQITVTLNGSIGPHVEVHVQGYQLNDKQRRDLLPIEREG
ncbi:MAG: hypothetical protein DMF66_07520, partial [Acidobacteria bacterium]